MFTLRAPGRWVPPVWIVPTALAAGLVILGATVAFAVVLALIGSIRSNALQIDQSGTAWQDSVAIEGAADHLLLFVASEEIRLAATTPGPIPQPGLLEADAQVNVIEGAAQRLRQRAAIDTALLPPESTDLRAAFLAYVNTPERSTLLALKGEAQAFASVADEAMPGFIESTTGRFSSLSSKINSLRLLVWMVVATAVPLVVGVIFFLGVRNHLVLQTIVQSGRALERSNATLERRNIQFEGLYRVVTEVTETLSMKYVVETTIREAGTLVGADAVVLRTLQDNLLILAGTNAAGDVRIKEDIELGAGLAGRVAKRARIMRGTPESSGEFIDPEASGLNSGVLLPLIVGARVVGTISCWSAEEDAFDDDDIRVLELMASQVATAIAAADLHEERGRQAFLDPLTQLPNRRQLTQDIRFEFDSAVRRGRQLTVAMVDVDHFKTFNDMYGHLAGDAALQQVAAVVTSSLRREDRVYRYGGEEFAIVFDTLDRAAAADACERICANVAQARMSKSADLSVTVSIGVASATPETEDFEELLIASDEALYAAKEAGRNRVVLAGERPDGGQATAA